VYKCPEISPKILEIPGSRPKISEIRLKNLEIRRKITEILEIRREISLEYGLEPFKYDLKSPKLGLNSIKPDFK